MATRRPGPRSRVERLYETLDADGQEVMRMVMSDLETSARIAARALTALGEPYDLGPISMQTVKELRLGQLAAWNDIANE